MSELKPMPQLGTDAIQSKSVTIVSHGILPLQYTKHVFAGVELEGDPEYGMLHPQWAVIYKCTKTGARRKFGVIDATPQSDKLRAIEQRGLQ